MSRSSCSSSALIEQTFLVSLYIVLAALASAQVDSKVAVVEGQCPCGVSTFRYNRTGEGWLSFVRKSCNSEMLKQGYANTSVNGLCGSIYTVEFTEKLITVNIDYGTDVGDVVGHFQTNDEGLLTINVTIEHTKSHWKISDFKRITSHHRAPNVKKFTSIMQDLVGLENMTILAPPRTLKNDISYFKGVEKEPEEWEIPSLDEEEDYDYGEDGEDQAGMRADNSEEDDPNCDKMPSWISRNWWMILSLLLLLITFALLTFWYRYSKSIILNTIDIIEERKLLDKRAKELEEKLLAMGWKPDTANNTTTTIGNITVSAESAATPSHTPLTPTEMRQVNNL